MKRILLFLVGVLIFIPNVIFADMGAPGIEEYRASISNKNGAVIYDGSYKSTSKTLEYGKTVTVNYEIDDYATIDGIDGFVKISDLTPIEKNYKMKPDEWTEKLDGIILKKVVVRRGPAQGYESVGQLNPEDKITIRLFKKEMVSWGYVETSNLKGYIDTYEGTVAYDPKEAKIITYFDVDFNEAQTKKKIQTIKTNTTFSTKIYSMDPWSHSYYMEYNGKKGIVTNYGVSVESQEVEFTAIRDINIYEKIDLNLDTKNYKKVGVIKKGEKFTSKNYDFWNGNNLIYYNGEVKGWILDEYLEGTNDSGFALKYNIDFNENEPKEKPISDDPIVDEPKEEKPNEEEQGARYPDETETNKRMPSNVTAYILLGAAIGATAVAVIALINKNKSEKKGKRK